MNHQSDFMLEPLEQRLEMIRFCWRWKRVCWGFWIFKVCGYVKVPWICL